MRSSRADERAIRGRDGVHVVWLKRDVRLTDHAPFAFASQQRKAIAIYVFEDAVIDQPETDASHLAFVRQSLVDLEGQLKESQARGGGGVGCEVGIPLVVMRGEMIEILQRVLKWTTDYGGMASLLSHEETGNALTYQRDARVAAWCEAHRVVWKQWPTTGVVRGLLTRDGWAGRWLERMQKPIVEIDAIRTKRLDVSSLGGANDVDDWASLRLPVSEKAMAQRGGHSAAERILQSFVLQRGARYQRDISSPQRAWLGSSRLSPHLAYGTISTRQVAQLIWQREQELQSGEVEMEPAERRAWLASLRSFESRLRWRDHFMQKLEDEPAIEFANMSRAYDDLRIEDPSQWGERERQWFEAWCLGRTGYPMIDACMRCLLATGWLNFRMRAMLSSFNAYHLWLHWRPAAVYLARHFLDFEPGIHFSQFQMQSGTTGINTVRMYNPMKQAIEHDPEGAFIRRWVPELRETPLEVIFAMGDETDEGTSLFGTNLGLTGASGGYPTPIVSHRQAYHEAREKIHAIRKTPAARVEAQRVYDKHGSRKGKKPEAWRVKFADDRGGAAERED